MTKEKQSSLEELMIEIEDILEKMDEQDISLEDSFLLYEKGMKKKVYKIQYFMTTYKMK